MYSYAFGWNLLYICVRFLWSNVSFKFNVSLWLFVWMMYSLLKVGYWMSYYCSVGVYFSLRIYHYFLSIFRSSYVGCINTNKPKQQRHKGWRDGVTVGKIFDICLLSHVINIQYSKIMHRSSTIKYSQNMFFFFVS